MERIQLEYDEYKSHVLNSITKNLSYQHIITSTGGDSYYFLFAPDGDAILYVCFINEATSTGQINVTDYETNYTDKANRQIEGRNKFERYFTSYANYIDEVKKRNRMAFLDVQTYGAGSTTSYLLSFTDGDQTFKYILPHSNTNEKNDFDINYLNISGKTISTEHVHSAIQHFIMDNTQTVNLWTPAQDFVPHLTSIYFHGYCNATNNKAFSLSVEIEIEDGWKELIGVTIKNTEESFREYIPYVQHIDMKKGTGSSVRMRAKITTDISIGNYSVKISLTGFEAK